MRFCHEPGYAQSIQHPKHSLTDLNDTGSVHRGRSDGVIARKGLTGTLDQRGDGQTVREARLEREAGAERRRSARGAHGRNRDRHRQVRAGEVDDGVVERADGSGHGEVEGRVDGFGRADNGQGAEGGQVDARERLRARAGHDEHLDRGEGEAGRSARQKGRGRGCLLLHEAVEADLFALLRQDGAEERDQRALVAGVGGEDGLGFGQGAEDYVGECLGEGDGLGEVGDGELIFAGLDGGVVGACEDAVYAQGVQFFLLLFQA